MKTILIAVMLLGFGCTSLESKIQDVRAGHYQYHVTDQDAIWAVWGQPLAKISEYALEYPTIPGDVDRWIRTETWYYPDNTCFSFQYTYLTSWMVRGELGGGT